MAKPPQSRVSNDEISLKWAIIIVMGVVIGFVVACLVIMYFAGYFDANYGSPVNSHSWVNTGSSVI